MAGFRYLIFPEHVYIVPVQDVLGNTQNIEIIGSDILKQTNIWYLQNQENGISYSYEQNAEKKSQQGCCCNCQKS